MLALPKSQKVYENPNFMEILLLSSNLPPPPLLTPKLMIYTNFVMKDISKQRRVLNFTNKLIVN